MIVLFLIVSGIISLIVSSATGGRQIHIETGSVLHMSFTEPLADRSDENPFNNIDFFSLKPNNQPGLNDLIGNLEKAKRDPSISGIYLDLSGLSGGMASIEELRNALMDFRESKKFILAYADFYSQGAYYLATTADQIWLNPEGEVMLNGFSVTIPFLKGTMEKLDLEPQVIRHGKFKSAVEPLVSDRMSDENREQIASYVSALWSHFVSEISVSRKIPEAEVLAAADSLSIRSAGDAQRMKLIDRVGYFDEFRDELKKQSGTPGKEMPELVTMNKYGRVPDPGPEKEFTRDKIAVIYATGDIVMGEGDPGQIGGESLSATIRKAREDDKVRAVVMRVNSPGGNSLASEIIWREMELCRKEKPVIVSMGDVAASGGYYISCNADTIVAQPNTITGSIGVFGVLFNAQGMFRNKLGVTFDSYKTSGYADIGTITRPLTESERGIIQQMLDKIYTTFTVRVSDGRKMPVSMVDSIGQGRVWSGVDAQKLGLVDVLGGLDDAITIAAKMAGLENYRISELPELKEPFRMFMEEFAEGAESRWLEWKLGGDYRFYRQLIRINELEGVQARTLYDTVRL